MTNSRFSIFGWKLRLILLLINSAAVLGYLIFSAIGYDSFSGEDARIYFGAVHDWWSGLDPYAFRHPETNFGFTYPPFALFFLSPISWLPGQSSIIVLQFLTIISLVYIIWITMKVLTKGVDFWTCLVIVPIFLIWYPVVRVVGSGQIDVILLALIITDVAYLRNSKWHGVLIGVAAAVKLTPLAILLVFVVNRRFLPIMNIVTIFVICQLLGILGTGFSGVRYWSEYLWETNRVGDKVAALNQSLSGLTSRIADYADASAAAGNVMWIFSVIIVVSLAYWGMRTVLMSNVEQRCFLIFSIALLVALLISPVSWLHHWVSAVPALIAAGVVAIQRKDIGLLFLSFLLWLSLLIPSWWYLGTYRADGGWSLLAIVIGSIPIFVVVLLIVRLSLVSRLVPLDPERGWEWR